jgi:hypothetical protein
LLIWTAFGVFSTQKAELQGIAANALEFNQETREYGPEAAHARALMRADLDYAHRQLWGDDQTKAAAIAASIRNMDSLSVVLDHMEPTTDAQKSLLADAKHNYKAIWQSRILMSLQGIDAVSWPVLYFVSACTHPTCARDDGARVSVDRAVFDYMATAVGTCAAASLRAFQAQGIISPTRWAGWSGSLARTSASHARGSMSLSLHVVISE